MYKIKSLYGNKLGDSGPNLAGLSSIFLNPKGYNILPYKHNYTKTGEYVETGFFIPAYTYIALPGCIDNRGVTDTKKARAYYENERNNLLDDPKSYMIECAEYCFTPDDALALEGDNQFDTNLLQEQLSNIILHKIGPRPVSGFLDYKFKPNTEEKEENICGFRWVPSPNGKIRILEEPELDESGRPYRDLYVAGIDSIDLGQSETASGTTDPSKFSIVIKKRTRGLEPSKYVAMYVDRPKDIREAYKNALKLLQYYNCKAVIEKSKVSLIMFFRDKKMDRKYLMRRPRATLNNKFTGKSNEYGVPATEEFIKHALELIGNYIADNCQEIWFQDMLEDLIKYSYENKRKFDIVASMEMAELGDEDMSGALPTEAIITKDQWKDVGWTKDKKGYIHFGVIEEQKVEPVDLFQNYDDDNRNRTSDPRYN